MSQHDASFMKHFAQLIAGLVVLAAVLVLVSTYIHGEQPQEPSPALLAAANARIAPVGAVHVGASGQSALTAAQAEAAPAASADDSAIDGAAIYSGLCGACHAAGVAGAPKLEQAAWTARTAQGFDTLVKHAVEGYTGSAGMMPARGGNPNLTDAEVRAAVQWMVDNLK
jgi:cytochrome c5